MRRGWIGRGTAVAAAVLLIGLAPPTRADDCSPGPDLTDCFCTHSINEVPSVYFGHIELEEDGPFLDFFFVVDALVSGEGVVPELALADRVYLSDAPDGAHSPNDSFLLYFYERIYGKTPILLEIRGGVFSISVPPGELQIRESLCVKTLSAEDVAAALISPSCRQTIRELAHLSSRDLCTEGGCVTASEDSGQRTALVQALLMAVLVLLIRRQRARN